MCVGVLRVLAHDNAPIEDRVRAAVDDTLVELAARAAGLSVLDERVVVDVLAPMGHIEAVQGARPAGAGEAHAQIVTGQPTAERNRAGGERAIARLDHLGRAHVEGQLPLLLDLIVLERGALAEDDLRDGVRAVGVVAETGVALDDRGLAPAIGDDQVPRLRQHRSRQRGREEEQMDRLRYPHTRREVHEGAVLGEGGVQGGEPVADAVRPRVAGEMPLEHRCVGDERFREARHPRTGGQRGQRGELG